MSQLKDALKKKIEKQGIYGNLDEKSKKDLAKIMATSVKDRRRLGEQKGKFFRTH